MEKLRDIKDIVDVVDYSLCYLVAVAICLLLLILFAIYYIKKSQKRTEVTSKDIALQNLLSIDYQDEKSIAYQFTLNIDYFIDKTNQEVIEKVLKRLEEFKYRKYVTKADRSIKKDIKDVIGAIK